MSHLLREKGVLLLPRRSSPSARPPLPLFSPPPFIASVPAGRQCHHSAASSSARLNTGPKVQTAARAGRCVLSITHVCKKKKKKNYITHTHLHKISLVSLAHIHRQISCGKAMAEGQSPHLHGGELVPWWWLVRQPNTNFINPEVNTLWTCVFPVFFTDLPTQSLTILQCYTHIWYSYMQCLRVMKCTVGMWM